MVIPEEGLRLIINGFYSEYYYGIIKKLYSDYQIGHCDILGSPFEGCCVEANSKLFNIMELVVGDYPSNFDELLPLDHKIIEDMAICEISALRMMDRHIPAISSDYHYRKRLYLKHLQYWNDHIIKNKVNLFISIGIPHETVDFIIYYLCKLYNIQTIIFKQSFIPDLFFLLDKITFDDHLIKKEYLSLKKYEHNSIIIPDYLENYFSKMSSRDLDRIPFYNTIFSNNRKKSLKCQYKCLKTLMKRYLNHLHLLFKPKKWLSVSKRIIDKLLSLFETEDATGINYYMGSCIKPNLDNKYIYFALATQPEESTSPNAGVFVDQLLIAQMLSYYLPDDIQIYVKEHPYQQHIKYGKTKNIHFYQDLKSINKVSFIDMNFNSFKLIENSIAVCTPSGTVGWEALFFEKPVLLFGTSFYQHADGVYVIKKAEDCKAAINDILNGKRCNLDNLRLYFKALYSSGFRGYVDFGYRGTFSVDHSVNIDNIYGALTNIINNFFNGSRILSKS